MSPCQEVRHANGMNDVFTSGTRLERTTGFVTCVILSGKGCAHTEEKDPSHDSMHQHREPASFSDFKVNGFRKYL